MKTRWFFSLFCLAFILGWTLCYEINPTRLLTFCFLGFAIGWAIYRLPSRVSNETLQTFFLYERRMPSNEFVGTLVTTNVGFFSSVAFSCVLIVTMGIGPAILAVVAWAGGLLWFSYYVPKLIPFFRRGSTVHEYISESFGRTPQQRRHLRFYSSTITFLLYLASIGAEIKFTSDVFSVPIGLSAGWLAAALSLAGIIYVSISGYRGVVSTDRLRFWAILIGVVAIYVYLWHSIAEGGFKLPPSFMSVGMLTFGPDPVALFALLLLLLMYQFCVMDMWERCIAIVNSHPEPQTEGTDSFVAHNIRRRIAWAIVPFVILFGAWYGIGLVSLAQNWTSDPNRIVPELINRLVHYSSQSFHGAIVETLIVLCFSAAALSTIDGFIIAAVQTVIFDWVPSFTADNKEWNEIDEIRSRDWLKWSRVTVLFVGVLAVGIAYTSFEIMNFWVGMYSLMLSFFPAIFFSIYAGKEFQEKHSSVQVILSIICGASAALIAAIVGTYVHPEWSLLAALPPFIAVAIAGFVLLLFSRWTSLKNWLIVLLVCFGGFYMSRRAPEAPSATSFSISPGGTNADLRTNNSYVK